MKKTEAGKKKSTAKKGKHPGGRPTLYDPKYCQEIIDYFSIPATATLKRKITRGKAVIEEEYQAPNPLPLFEDFASSIGVHVDTLQEWKKVHPEFSVAYAHAKQRQKAILIKNGTLGNYQPQFTIFVAKNIAGMSDTQTHDVTDRLAEVLKSAQGTSLGLPSERRKDEE